MTDRWTWHGGGIAAARARFGEGDAPWMDLSTGINPHGWAEAQPAAPDWTALPDEQALRELEAAAAAHFGADLAPVCPTHVCAVPGTEIGLRLISRLLLPGKAFYLEPSYRTHAAMFGGATPITADRIGAADYGTLLLANPNNPNGHIFNRQDLLPLLDQRGTHGWLIIDEAFTDTHPEISLCPCVRDGRPLVIFRSFGKFFGLPGLRLGFILGPSPLLERVREALGAWPVSSAAIAIGTKAYRDTGWSETMRRRLRGEAQAMDALLLRHGFRVMGDCPLFRLIETPRAHALFSGLARRQILTRPFDYRPDWLRMGLPRDKADLQRLDRALRETLAEMNASRQTTSHG